MDNEEQFSEFKDRLRVLDEEIRVTALEYAVDFFSSGKMSKAQAMEKGITRAEIEKRNL